MVVGSGPRMSRDLPSCGFPAGATQTLMMFFCIILVTIPAGVLMVFFLFFLDVISFCCILFYSPGLTPFSETTYLAVSTPAHQLFVAGAHHRRIPAHNGRNGRVIWCLSSSTANRSTSLCLSSNFLVISVSHRASLQACAHPPLQGLELRGTHKGCRSWKEGSTGPQPDPGQLAGACPVATTLTPRCEASASCVRPGWRSPGRLCWSFCTAFRHPRAW